MEALPTHPDLLTKNSNKLPRLEYQTAPPPRVDPDKESKDREHKLPIPIQTTPPSVVTMEKYTKNLKELVKQRHCGHYTGNKYDTPLAIHRYSKREQGTRVEPMAQHFEVIAKNIRGNHEANVFIDPTTGSSLEYRHLIKGLTKVIRENSPANETCQLAQGVGKSMP